MIWEEIATALSARPPFIQLSFIITTPWYQLCCVSPLPHAQALSSHPLFPSFGASVHYRTPTHFKCIHPSVLTDQECPPHLTCLHHPQACLSY